LAATVDGATILTIEGLAGEKELHPLQKSFVQHGAIQCGFCTPGMVMSSLALITENPTATESEIKEAISGNICRCTGYTKIIKAITSIVEEYKAANMVES
jgi:carbon-monoxide dehydrogenase small subunit